MQIIKNKIRFNSNSGATIMINIGSHDSFLGAQQEINTLIGNVSNALINPTNDVERWRFKYLPTSHATLNFNFKEINISTFLSGGAGFTNLEVNSKTLNFLNSFFVLDLYDNYDPNIQTKIFTTYLTKLGEIPKYILGLDTTNIYSNTEFTYLYIPQWYIDSCSGLTSTAYIRFSFYNAKSGQTSVFYNQDTSALTTQEKMYFKIQLDFINKQWHFTNIDNTTANANELTISSAYVNRIDNTMNKQPNITQVYPTGSTGSSIFNYNTAKYC